MPQILFVDFYFCGFHRVRLALGKTLPLGGSLSRAEMTPETPAVGFKIETRNRQACSNTYQFI